MTGVSDFHDYKSKITKEPPAKSTTVPIGEFREAVYHYREDGTFITGCVRMKDAGPFQWQITQIMNNPKNLG